MILEALVVNWQSAVALLLGASMLVAPTQAAAEPPTGLASDTDARSAAKANPAVTRISLPAYVTGFWVDEARGDLYYSRVSETDGDGTLYRARLDGSDPVAVWSTGLRLFSSPDGATLWVTGSCSVAAIDVDSWVGTTFPGPDRTQCPRRVSASNTSAWVFWDESDAWLLDPTEGVYHEVDGVPLSDDYYPLPEGPTTVITTSTNFKETRLARYALSQGATWKLTKTHETSAEPAYGLAWSSAGPRFFTSIGDEFRTSNLTKVRSTTGRGARVATNGAGLVAYASLGQVSIARESASPYKTETWGRDEPNPWILQLTKSHAYVLTYDALDGPTDLIVVDIRPRTPLGLKSTHSVYRAGQRPRLRISLDPAVTNRQVSLTVTEAGKPSSTRTYRVPASGLLTVKPKTKRNLTVRAVSTGDGSFLPKTVTLSIKIRPELKIRPVNATGKVGRYRLFRASRPAVFGGTVRPAVRGTCVHYPTQALVDGHWEQATEAPCVHTNRRGKTTWRLTGRSSVVGIPLRTWLVKFKSDDSQGGRSHYLYWKFAH